MQPEGPEGAWMYKMNLVAAFEYMKVGLKLAEGAVELVHPELLKLFTQVVLEGLHETAPEEEIKEMEEVQLRRKAKLQQLFNAKAVVFVPAHHLDHWSLLVVDNRFADARVLSWRDSLSPGPTTAGMKTFIEAAVKEILDLEFVAETCNKALQPPGTAVCGCYVLHWMEQTCRKLLLNEPGCSIGWPKSADWAARVLKLVEMMQKEQGKLQKEADEAKLKMFASAAKLKAAEVAADGAAKKDKMLQDLKADADSMGSKIPAGKPCLENLSPAAQNAVFKASLGGGVCSKCRWRSGCMECHKEKALFHWLKVEGFIEEHMVYKPPV